MHIERKREPLTEAEIRRLKAAYETGVSLNDLAKRFRVSTQTLQKIFGKRR